jgi:hypothetical protein
MSRLFIARTTDILDYATIIKILKFNETTQIMCRLK